MSSLIQDLTQISQSPRSIILDGTSNLSLSDVYAVANHGSKVTLEPTQEVLERIAAVRSAMAKQIETGVPIYGVSSAYGGQAGRVLNQGGTKDRYQQAKKISEAIIHVDVSTGPPIPTAIVRAALLIRINMLLPGYSAIRLELLEKMLNY